MNNTLLRCHSSFGVIIASCLMGLNAYGGTANYNALINTASPTVHLGLDESSGTTAADASGNSHTGTYGTSGITKANSSLGLNIDKTPSTTGATTLITIPGSTAFNYGTGNYSIEMCFKPGNATTTRQDLLAFEGNTTDVGVFLNSNGAGSIAFFNNSTTQVTAAGVVSPNQWHYLAITRASGNLAVYLDGAVVKTATGDTQNINGNSSIYIGASKPISGVSAYHFVGPIDEFALYGSALTPAQVASHYAAVKAPVPEQLGATIYSAPITITTGGTYTGNWLSTNPSTPAITINTTAPVTIINSRIMGPGDLINDSYHDSNLTVTNCVFTGTNPNVNGTAPGRAIQALYMGKLLVQYCDFEHTGGVFVQGVNSYVFPTYSIGIYFNRFHDVEARFSDGANGWQTNFYLYSAVQIANQYGGVPSAEVAWNQFINDPYNSRVEDTISFFNFNASSSSPALVHDNYIQGGYPAYGGGTYTGTAINAEGQGSDLNTIGCYTKIYNNQLVNSGGGIAISGGHDNQIYNNRVVSSGRLADGTPISSGGIVCWNWTSSPSPYWGNHSIYNNMAGVVSYDFNTSTFARGDYWFPDTPTVAYGNTSWSPNDTAHPTTADEAAETASWQSKLATNGIIPGCDLTTPLIYSNVATGGTASASSEYAPTQGAAQAFDGRSDTKWITMITTASGTLQYHFASGVTWAVNQYQITSANDVPARDPFTWQFQASLDGSTWVTLDYEVGQIFDSRYQTKTFNFVNTVAYPYYRLNITANKGGSSQDIQIGDVALNVEGASSWLTQDIGDTAANGTANYTYSTYTHTISGSGADIVASNDAFRYVYLPLAGNGSITARVVSQGATDAWAKAGVMIRESLTAISPFAAVFVTPSNGIAFQYRTALYTNAAYVGGASGTAPYWVRIVRSGNLFTAYQSTNGTTWTSVGSATFTMATNAYVGLPVTAHHNGLLSSVVFDNVTVTP